MWLYIAVVHLGVFSWSCTLLWCLYACGVYVYVLACIIYYIVLIILYCILSCTYVHTYVGDSSPEQPSWWTADSVCECTGHRCVHPAEAGHGGEGWSLAWSSPLRSAGQPRHRWVLEHLMQKEVAGRRQKVYCAIICNNTQLYYLVAIFLRVGELECQFIFYWTHIPNVFIDHLNSLPFSSSSTALTSPSLPSLLPFLPPFRLSSLPSPPHSSPPPRSPHFLHSPCREAGGRPWNHWGCCWNVAKEEIWILHCKRSSWQIQALDSPLGEKVHVQEHYVETRQCSTNISRQLLCHGSLLCQLHSVSVTKFTYLFL